MNASIQVWESAQVEVLKLLKEGRGELALELQEALDESLAMGGVTTRLMKVQTSILIGRAEATMEVAKQALLSAALQEHTPFIVVYKA